MKKIKLLFLWLVAFTGMFVAANAQDCNKCVNSSADFTFLGIDYSFLSFDKELEETEATVINKYIPAWNNLFLTERSKYDVEKLLGLKTVDYDIDFFENSNSKLTDINEASQDLSDADIVNHIKKINFSKVTTQYALLLLAHTYSKSTATGEHFFVVYDVKAKNIVAMKKVITKSRGFGFRNYWASTFYGVFKNNKDVSRLFK